MTTSYPQSGVPGGSKDTLVFRCSFCCSTCCLPSAIDWLGAERGWRSAKVFLTSSLARVLTGCQKHEAQPVMSVDLNPVCRDLSGKMSKAFNGGSLCQR